MSRVCGCVRTRCVCGTSVNGSCKKNPKQIRGQTTRAGNAAEFLKEAQLQ